MSMMNDTTPVNRKNVSKSGLKKMRKCPELRNSGHFFIIWISFFSDTVEIKNQYMKFEVIFSLAETRKE